MRSLAFARDATQRICNRTAELTFVVESRNKIYEFLVLASIGEIVYAFQMYLCDAMRLTVRENEEEKNTYKNTWNLTFQTTDFFFVRKQRESAIVKHTFCANELMRNFDENAKTSFRNIATHFHPSNAIRTIHTKAKKKKISMALASYSNIGNNKKNGENVCKPKFFRCWKNEMAEELAENSWHFHSNASFDHAFDVA